MTLLLKNISAGYSGFRVLHDVSLAVEQGEIHVLLGGTVPAKRQRCVLSSA